MIGKLHVWRGERGGQKKEALAQDKIRARGFASLDESDRKSKDASPLPLPSPNKPDVAPAPAKKRAPRLSIGRRSFSLGPSRPGEDPSGFLLAQPARQDLSLFSNIPAVTSAGLDRPPSSSGFQPSPPRPQTANQDRSLHRIASRTAPAVSTPTNDPRSQCADKPLPLAIDFDQARKRSSSISSQPPSIQSMPDEARSSHGVSISRPKTSSSGDSPNRRKRSGSFTGRPPAATPSYSLTPVITPQHSRRPSMNGVQHNHTSRDTLNKSNSTASANGFTHGTRASSSSRTSVNTHGLRSPIEQTSLLDEVEGTLNATITQLQGMQIGFGDDTVNNLSFAQRRRPSEPPKSAPANQGYFPRSSPYPTKSTSNSLPPTPIVPISDGSDDQAHSIQSTIDKQRRDLHTALVENDTLKKQLSLLQTRLANNDTIQIERDQFEELYQESQANLQESVKHGQTLIDKLNLSRDKEEALQNNVLELKHRLEEANMHKLDAQHHHYEMEDKLKLIEENYKALQEQREREEQKRMSFEADKSVLRQEIAKLPALHQEIAYLRQRPQQSALDEALNKQKVAEERARNLELQLVGDGRADLSSKIADLGFKMEDLQRGLTEKDRRTEELEAANKLLSKNAKFDKNYSNRIRSLERTIAEQHKTFRTIQAERDQLRQLIYTEFRRTANGRQHPATLLLEKKVEVDTAIMQVRKRAQEFLRSQKRRDDDDDDSTATDALRVEELEQEIDYHVKDIILYKLDVKGYKKDVKRAQMKLARLEGICSHENGLTSQNSIKDYSAKRPSISSGDSENSVAQAVGGVTHENDASSTDEEVSPSAKKMGRVASVYYSPDASPASSPKKEKKGFNVVGTEI